MTGRQGHNAASKPGEVGFQETKHAEPMGLTLDNEPNLSDWTPVQVDTKLADLYYTYINKSARAEGQQRHLEDLVRRKTGTRGRLSTTEIDAVVAECRAVERQTYIEHDILRAYENTIVADEEVMAASEAMLPYEDEFNARGGWTRAFLVTNAGGHVHSSMMCSTCRPTTRYHWVTEYSGGKEADVVDAAGERACTVCYPSAPVETLNKPTKMFTPDEIQAAKDREARAAAKVERDAKKVEKALTADGSEFEIEFISYGRPDKERFKTEQAATSWLVGKLVDERYWTEKTPDPTLIDAQNKVKQAIADKHNMTMGEVDEMLEKKIKAKAKRDGWI
ncbi:hypothetical protein [Aeromicrobium sp. 179-A 4D2 NHS]|uniref:hypothetical protein n=1 Tax=Aeromicrobium sp. 179-A 4D2 NHS TaxID=3142375 RepID=UPI00399F1696